MRLRFVSATVLSIGLTSSGGVALADGVDVLFRVGASGEVATGGFNDDTQMVETVYQRVYGADFGAGGDANFADEPGFQSFDPRFDGDDWSFTLTGPARIWDTVDGDFDDIAPFTVTFGFGFTATTPLNEGETTPGFDLPIPDGGFHDHLDITYDAPDQSATHNAVILVPLTVSTTSFTESNEIYLVLNRGFSEDVHDAAIDFANTTFVPAPGAALAFGAAFGALLARRRRA